VVADVRYTLTDRVKRTKRVVDQATLMPFLIRCGISVAFLLALAVAWPVEVLAGRFLPALLIAAAWPAVAPRGRAATVVVLLVVAGWIFDTTWNDARIALWRVLAMATLLYLGHTLAALAAVLPYDALVNADVVVGWLGRALIVVLISAVLTVIALGLSTALAGEAFLVATLVGLAAAVGATLLLVRLIKRA
jgi:hypothetical protein